MEENKIKKVRPKDLKALLSRAKGPKVYVSPTTGEVSDEPRKDAMPVPKSHWFEEGSTSFFIPPAVKEIISLHVNEMSVYFPDFKLYSDKDGIYWLGKIDGIGRIRIRYPLTYPAQKFKVEASDLPESFTDELQKLIWSYEGITPAGAIIVLMRLFLLKRGEVGKNAVVPDSS